MKKNENCADQFLCGLAQGEHEYFINGVKYVATSRFEPYKNKINTTINERFGKAIISDFTPLTKQLQENKIAEEYVCSGCIASDDAGKED